MTAEIGKRPYYGWWVAVTSTVIVMMSYGVRNSYGVFFKSIESDFDLSRAATSGIFAAYSGFCVVVCIFGGWALDRYGPRKIILAMGLLTGIGCILTSQVQMVWQLFVTYSLLLAAGTGAIYPLLLATVSPWFFQKRGRAVGITGAGVGLGTMALAPLVTYLIVNFGWRVAFLVIGIGAGLTIVLLSRVLVKASPAPGQVPGGLTAAAAPPAGTSLPRALRGGNFWLFFSFWAFWSICLHLILTHFVPHATDSGVTATTAGVMISLFAGASVVGRLVSGVLCERWHKKAISILSIALQAAVMVWLVWSREPWQLYLFAAAFGFGYGSAEPPLLAMIGEIFGFRYIGAIMGTMLASFPLGAVIGPLLGGYLYDFSGNYDAAFVAGAACLALAAFAVTLIRKPPHAAGPAPAQT